MGTITYKILRILGYMITAVALIVIIVLMFGKNSIVSRLQKPPDNKDGATTTLKTGDLYFNSAAFIEPSNISYGEIENNLQRISMDISLNEFLLSILVLQKDVETEWILSGIEIDKSNNFIYFPEYEAGFVNYGTNYRPKYIDLVMGENLLTIIPRQDFIFKSRNGEKGFVKVVEDIGKVDMDSLVKDIQTFVPILGCCIIQYE